MMANESSETTPSNVVHTSSIHFAIFGADCCSFKTSRRIARSKVAGSVGNDNIRSVKSARNAEIVGRIDITMWRVKVHHKQTLSTPLSPSFPALYSPSDSPPAYTIPKNLQHIRPSRPNPVCTVRFSSSIRDIPITTRPSVSRLPSSDPLAAPSLHHELHRPESICACARP